MIEVPVDTFSFNNPQASQSKPKALRSERHNNQKDRLIETPKAEFEIRRTFLD